jgi:hypothetical protein
MTEAAKKSAAGRGGWALVAIPAFVSIVVRHPARLSTAVAGRAG